MTSPNAEPVPPQPGADAPPPRANRSARRTLAVAAVLVVAVLAVVVGVVLSQRGGGDETTGLENAPGDLGLPTLQNRPAPDSQFQLPPATLDAFGGGEPVDVASYGGTPLVVNFWATWCAPCVREMPDFQEVAAETEGDVVFLGIDVMDAALNAEPFVEDLGITYDLAVDLRGDYWRGAGSFGMPTTLFVQPDGTVVYRQTGALDAVELRQLLQEHLGVDTA